MTMIEVKTAELIGPALDWAVAKVEGAEFGLATWRKLGGKLSYSADWAQGGPLLDRLMRSGKWELVQWDSGKEVALQNFDSECLPVDGVSYDDESIHQSGETVLIAACRAIVAAKLGEVVSVPAELAGGSE